MPDGREPITVKVATALCDVPAAAWDACAGDGNPFVRHAFLSALEDSGSVTAETGWLPQHLVIEDGAGGVLACAPLYLKNHSYGEYVFDWGWAEAYQRAGGRYYPKLQASVPFTPVTGPRLLTRSDIAPDARVHLQDALIAGMIELAERLKVSSLHVTFPTEAEWRRMGSHGLLLRVGQQFHWKNDGYRTFDDFLAALASRKRKAIRKERAHVAAQGVSLRAFAGGDVTEAHWDVFFAFYCNTVDHKWGGRYLTRPFFSLLGERLRDHVVLVVAERGGRPVAGALNVLGGDTLFGRNWGCVEDCKFLHFEACYYRAIEFAIERGLKWVEAGAQGPHKIQRGYLPRLTYSAHWIRDAGFRDAVARYLAREQAQVEAGVNELMALSPFRKCGAGTD